MHRKFAILIALIILALPVAGARAGSMDNVFCGDLPEADCQILLDNAAVMDEVFASAFSMTMEMGFSGESPAENMQLTVMAEGRLAADPTLATQLTALEAAPDAHSVSTLFETLFAAMQGEITLNMTGTVADEPSDMMLNLLIKDGIIVLNAGAMEAMTGESMGGMEWFGVDTSEALGDLLGEAGMGSITDMAGMSSSTMDEAQAEATMIARLPDEVVAGIPVAVFESTIDLKSIMHALTTDDIQAASPDQSGEANMALAMMQGMDARELSSRQYIGIADHFTHRMQMAMDLTMGGESIGAGDGDISLTMNFDIYLSAFNQPVNIELPEDAFVFPLAMMLQMGDQ